MTLKKREFTPESGSVDTYAICILKNKSSILVVRNKIIHTQIMKIKSLYLHNLFIL